jgi:N-methylhydantoinase A
MLLSGPAGGVIGALHVAGATGYDNLITMDVGGTSFDVAMIKNRVASTHQETEVNAYPILISNLDIRTIGAGGGSLAWIDSANGLHVGPQSAGANPGPVCYRRGGTQPTVTDALLVNGLINEKNFLGGEMSLDLQGAQHGIRTQVADPFGMELLKASSGMLRIVMNNMAEAVKSIAAETGDDPRDFGMLCFGGGGPIFGAFLIDELAMPVAIVPALPAGFSAWGMLMVDLRHDVAQTVVRRLEAMTIEELVGTFAELTRRGRNLLELEGVSSGSQTFQRSADMRYSGQEHSVSVPLDFEVSASDAKEKLHEAFQAAYKAVYGYTLAAPAEIVNLRVKAIGVIPKPAVRDIATGDGDPRRARLAVRPAYDFLADRQMDFTAYDRAALRAGDVIAGAALIEEPTTTSIVRSGQTCRVDRVGNLLISRTADMQRSMAK